MDSERREVENLLGGARGIIGRNVVSVHQCGIGKVNAAIGAVNIIEKEHPDAVISTGVAGGIDSSLDVMDVVAGAETCYHDVWCGDGNEYGQVQGLPARYESDVHLLAAAKEMGLHCGLICTGDKFITDRTKLDEIKSAFPSGLAVDMESAAIAQTCHIYKVPFLSLRIISDTPGNTDNHPQQYATFWQDMATKSFQTLRDFLRKV